MSKTTEALKMAIEAFYAFMDEKITDEEFTKMQWTACQACKEALESQDDLMEGTWIRYNDGDDTKRLILELDIAMNGIDGAAKSPALIDVVKQAIDYFKEGKKYHVLPIDDIKTHEQNERCECNPKVEVYGSNKVFIHNSFDGREALESQDIKQLNDEYLRDTYVEGLSQEHTMTYEQGFEHGYEAHRVESQEQEPVAWMVFDSYGNGEYIPNDNNKFFTKQTSVIRKPIPLYTHPAQPLTRDWIGTALERADKDEAFRKGLIGELTQSLSDDEILAIVPSIEQIKPQNGMMLSNEWNILDFARAIEKAHGIGVKDA